VRRRIAFDAGPAAFAERFAAAEAVLAADIAAARERLPAVVLDDAALELIAEVCASFDVDGLRADIVIARTAAAHAAWRGAAAVTREDIRAASRLALPHRRRRNPFDAPGLDEQQLDDALGGPDEEPEPDPPSGGGPGAPDGPGNDGRQDAGDRDDAPSDGDGQQAPAAAAPTGQVQEGQAQGEQAPGGRESVVPSGAAFRARRLEVPGKGQGAAGRRSRAATDAGRSVGARPPLPPARDAGRAPDRDADGQRAAPAAPRAVRARPAA